MQSSWVQLPCTGIVGSNPASGMGVCRVTLHCLRRYIPIGQSCQMSNIKCKSNRYTISEVATLQKQRTAVSSIIDTTWNFKAHGKHLTKHKAHPTWLLSLCFMREAAVHVMTHYLLRASVDPIITVPRGTATGDQPINMLRTFFTGRFPPQQHSDNSTTFLYSFEASFNLKLHTGHLTQYSQQILAAE